MLSDQPTGSGVVVLDTEEYIKKVSEDLEQNGKYEKLKNDTTQQVTYKVRKIVKSLHQSGMIDDELKQYMMPNNINQGKVKENPKIHKQNNPIRSIISTVNHPTEKWQK